MLRPPSAGKFSFTKSIEHRGSQREVTRFCSENAEKVHVYIKYNSFKEINEQNKDVLNWLSAWAMF